MAKQATKRLDSMALTELIAFRDRVETAIQKLVEKERGELQSKIDALQAFATSPVRRVARKASVRRTTRNKRASHPLKGTKAPVKYRGPNGETWSGRGLAPRWLAALEKKGKKRDSFLV